MADWLTREQRSRNMAAIRSSGTKPEAALRLLLRDIVPRRVIKEGRTGLPGNPDFYLPGLRLAVFMDGCFWHGCPQHGRNPEDNAEYWASKLARTKQRDRAACRALRAMNIRPLRIWEHELRWDPLAARRRVVRAIGRLTSPKIRCT